MITNTLKSSLNNIDHNAYPADNVDIPNCLDFRITLYRFFCNVVNDSS